jgi:hypothetical protein
MRFDQDITLKAYKSELLSMEQNLSKDFVSQKLLDNAYQKIAEMEKTFDNEKSQR